MEFKRHIINKLLIIVTYFMLVSCEQHRLAYIEKLMETNIEMADSLILVIGEPIRKNNQAHYAILKTQIDYKKYRDIPNDNAIRIATDYYGTNSKDYYAAMAWYSLGCVAELNNQDSTAVDAYLTALKLFPDTSNRYYALTEQNLSYIYLEHKMEKEAIDMIVSCRTNAVRLNDSAAIAFCDFNIANSLLYKNKYNKAEEIYLRVKDSKWLSPNTSPMPYIQLAKIAMFRDSNYIEAITYADSFIVRNNNIVPKDIAYSIKADAYYGIGNIDSALQYYNLSIIDSNDPYIVCDAYRSLSEIYTIQNKTDSATFFAKQAGYWMDSIVSATSSSYLYRIINKHTSIPKQLHLLPKYVLTSAIVLFIILLTIFQIKKKKSAEHIKHTTITDFELLINDFKESRLYNDMSHIIDHQALLSANQRNSITNEFRNSLAEVRNYLHNSSTNINQVELDYCIFTMIGFKQKDFHLFFNISHSGSRNLKARIKTKLSESTYNYIFKS